MENDFKLIFLECIIELKDNCSSTNFKHAAAHTFYPESRPDFALMHQSIPAAPQPHPHTQATVGHLPAFTVQGVGHFQISLWP